MNNRQTNLKPQPVTTTASDPLKSGVLQRKCACGQHIIGNECTSCRKENETTLQRSAVNHDSVGSAESDVPPIVHDVLQTPGQPLDPNTRAFMEPRFGHDFSRVRVHTDAQAAESTHAVDALAYTVGQDIVLGDEHSRPQSLAGYALIAHELTHTIQQKTASSDTANETPALELEADRTMLDVLSDRPPRIGVTAAVPGVQFLRVTSGGFGRALEEFTNLWNIPDSTVRLLLTSATFMRLARTLDQNFVARTDSAPFNPEVSANGIITSGGPGMPRRMIGKRELMVIRDDPAFLPVQTPDNPLSADLIQVNQLDAPGFIQELGHEVTHAANFVGASPPAAQTLVAEINAGIQEEISVRQSEATILGEVNNPQVRQQVAQVGSRVTSEVQRDIAPAIGMTYLESFFFARRLRDAQANDQITEDKAREIREVISLAVKHGLAVPDWYGEYGRVWLDRETVRKEWTTFHETNRRSDPGYDAAREQLLQDHAQRFFGGQVSYGVRPTPAVPATP